MAFEFSPVDKTQSPVTGTGGWVDQVPDGYSSPSAYLDQDDAGAHSQGHGGQLPSSIRQQQMQRTINNIDSCFNEAALNANGYPEAADMAPLPNGIFRRQQQMQRTINDADSCFPSCHAADWALDPTLTSLALGAASASGPSLQHPWEPQQLAPPHPHHANSALCATPVLLSLSSYPDSYPDFHDTPHVGTLDTLSFTSIPDTASLIGAAPSPHAAPDARHVIAEPAPPRGGPLLGVNANRFPHHLSSDAAAPPVACHDQTNTPPPPNPKGKRIGPLELDVREHANLMRDNKLTCITCKIRKTGCYGKEASLDLCRHCAHKNHSHYCIPYYFLDFAKSITPCLIHCFGHDHRIGIDQTVLHLRSLVQHATGPIHLAVCYHGSPAFSLDLIQCHRSIDEATSGASPFPLSLQYLLEQKKVLAKTWENCIVQLPQPLLPSLGSSSSLSTLASSYYSSSSSITAIPPALKTLAVLDHMISPDKISYSPSESFAHSDTNLHAIGSLLNLMISYSVYKAAYDWLSTSLGKKDRFSEAVVIVLEMHVYALRRRIALCPSNDSRNDLVELCKRIYLSCCFIRERGDPSWSYRVQGQTLDPSNFDEWLENDPLG